MREKYDFSYLRYLLHSFPDYLTLTAASYIVSTYVFSRIYHAEIDTATICLNFSLVGTVILFLSISYTRSKYVAIQLLWVNGVQYSVCRFSVKRMRIEIVTYRVYDITRTRKHYDGIQLFGRVEMEARALCKKASNATVITDTRSNITMRREYMHQPELTKRLINMGCHQSIAL